MPIRMVKDEPVNIITPPVHNNTNTHTNSIFDNVSSDTLMTGGLIGLGVLGVGACLSWLFSGKKKEPENKKIIAKVQPANISNKTTQISETPKLSIPNKQTAPLIVSQPVQEISKHNSTYYQQLDNTTVSELDKLKSKLNYNKEIISQENSQQNTVNQQTFQQFIQQKKIGTQETVKQYVPQITITPETKGKLESSKICVSVWSIVSKVDFNLQEQEKQAFELLINSFINDLFSDIDIPTKEHVRQELNKTLTQPLTYNEIIAFAKVIYPFMYRLYQQACYIAIADKTVNEKERTFLDKFAKDLELKVEDKNAIEEMYKLRTETTANEFTIANNEAVDITFELSENNINWQKLSLLANKENKYNFAGGKQNFGFIRIITSPVKQAMYRLESIYNYTIYWNKKEEKWDVLLKK